MSLSRSQQQPTASQQQKPAQVQPKDVLGGPCTAPGGFTEVLYQGKLTIHHPADVMLELLGNYPWKPFVDTLIEQNH